jgi:hypothetical protein
MCLITLSWQPTHKTPLIIAANRDEFYDRPAQPLHGDLHLKYCTSHQNSANSIPPNAKGGYLHNLAP